MHSARGYKHVKLWSTDVDNPMSCFWSPPPTEPLFVIFVASNRRSMLKPQNLGFIFWDKFTTTEISEWFSSSFFLAWEALARDPKPSKLVKLPHVKLAVWGSFAVELQPFFRNTLPRSARGRWLGPPVRVSAVHGEWLCHVSWGIHINWAGWSPLYISTFFSDDAKWSQMSMGFSFACCRLIDSVCEAFWQQRSSFSGYLFG